MRARWYLLVLGTVPVLVGCPSAPAPQQPPQPPATVTAEPPPITPDDPAVIADLEKAGAKLTVTKGGQVQRVDASGVSFTDPAEALAFLTKVGKLPFVVEVKVFGPGIDNAAVEALKDCRTLRAFEAVNSSISEAGIATLASLPLLESLYARRANIGLGLLSNAEQANQVNAALGTAAEKLASGTPINDIDPAALVEEPALKQHLDSCALKAISASESIRNLDLRYTNVSDLEVAYLGRMSQLKVLRLEESRVTDKCVPFLAQMTGLTFLNLKGATFSSAGLKDLKTLVNLTNLELDDTRLTDEGLLELAPLTKLRELHLRRTQVANPGMAVLAHMPDLRVLKLRDTLVTDVGLAHVAGLKNLVELDLSEGIFSDKGLVHLAGLTNLENLSLWATDTTDEGLDQLAGLTKLRVLSLEKTRVTDAGIPKLAALTNLTDLNLGETEIGSEGVLALKELKGLKKLTLSNCYNVGSDAVDELKAALPNLEVVGP